MVTIKTTPARLRAAMAWSLPDVHVLDGRGPGRHPFVQRQGAPTGWPPDLAQCTRCARPRLDPIHHAPKRRRIAAFGKNATPKTRLSPCKTDW